MSWSCVVLYSLGKALKRNGGWPRAHSAIDDSSGDEEQEHVVSRWQDAPTWDDYHANNNRANGQLGDLLAQ